MGGPYCQSYPYIKSFAVLTASMSPNSTFGGPVLRPAIRLRPKIAQAETDRIERGKKNRRIICQRIQEELLSIPQRKGLRHSRIRVDKPQQRPRTQSGARVKYATSG